MFVVQTLPDHVAKIQYFLLSMVMTYGLLSMAHCLSYMVYGLGL